MKSLTVSRRIVSGFALLLALTVFLGGFAAFRMRVAANGAGFLANSVVPQAAIASRIAEASAKVQLAARTYGLTGDIAQLSAARQHLAEVRAAMNAGEALLRRDSSLVALAAGLSEGQVALAEYEK